MMLIALPIIVVVVAYLAWRNREVRECRWRANTEGNKGALRKYRCAACGAEAFTASAGPPNSCKRGLGKTAL